MKWKKIKTVCPVIDVSCGHQFTVFCDTEGHVYSFGHPEYGQLGQNIVVFVGRRGDFVSRSWNNRRILPRRETKDAISFHHQTQEN